MPVLVAFVADRTDELAALVRWLSPVAEGLSASERAAAETPRQLANAHSVFNVGNTFIFIWFVPVFARRLPAAAVRYIRPSP